MNLHDMPHKVVVLTPDKESAKELLGILKGAGYKWINGMEINPDAFEGVCGPFCSSVSVIASIRAVSWGRVETTWGVRKMTLEEFKKAYAKEDEADCDKPGNESESCRELDLCKILERHVGEHLYSPCYGVVRLDAVKSETVTVASANDGKRHTLTGHGRHPSGEEPMLYPSRGLYESYTFEGAWAEWLEGHKKVAYEDICKELFEDGRYTVKLDCQKVKQVEKLQALNKLMNVQKWIEKGWRPDCPEEYCYYFYINPKGELKIDFIRADCRYEELGVEFSSDANARKALEILGEDVIRQALSTDW